MSEGEDEIHFRRRFRHYGTRRCADWQPDICMQRVIRDRSLCYFMAGS